MKGWLKMTEFVDGTLTEVIVTIVGIFASWALAQLGNYVNAKKKEVISNTTNENVHFYANTVADIVNDVINVMNKNVVNELKIASCDGKLTSEEMCDIALDARNQILSSISDDAKSVLSNVYGNLDNWIDTLISKYVEEAKGITGLTSEQAMQIAEERRQAADSQKVGDPAVDCHQSTAQ